MSGHPEADIYHRQDFGHASGIGAAPALVIVDFVAGFADPTHFGGGNITAAIDRTTELLALARARGWPVAHTRVVYAADGSDAGVFTLKAPSLRKLTETSPLSQIVPVLAPAQGELVIRKQGASAFFGTSLAAWLAFRRVDTVIVAGCTTSGCVRATVVDAMQHNFRTICVTDCVGDRAQAPHEANLFDIGQKYADLMTLAQLEAAVASAAPISTAASPPRAPVPTPAAAPASIPPSIPASTPAAAPPPRPAVAPAPIAEVREDEAGPDIAAIYAELRQASGVPLVNLIWRHAATLPGVLPWMWRVAGPVLRSGAVATATRRIAQGMPLPALREADAIAAGLQLADVGRILDVVEAYNRGNLTNLVLLGALRRLLQDGPAAQRTAPGGPANPPRMLPAVPKIPRLPDLPAPLQDRVTALAALHGAEAGGVIPSLYLHLALWPTVLEALPAWLGPVLTPEGLGTGRLAALTLAEREADALWPMLGDEPPPDAAQREFAATLERFTTRVIPAMVPVGLALRKALAGE